MLTFGLEKIKRFQCKICKGTGKHSRYIDDRGTIDLSCPKFNCWGRAVRGLILTMLGSGAVYLLAWHYHILGLGT